MKNKFSFLLFFFFVLLISVVGQQHKEHKFMFYNVENLFDHINDSLVNDGEFTPDGERKWTAYKSRQKINNIARVIIAAGKFNPPDFVGLAEVENKNVLDQLIFKSPLKKFKYSLVHKESPDRRGIDVALLYNPKVFMPLENRFLRVELPSGEPFFTREILYSKGLINATDTLHIFVNHWPSRYGGELKSRPLRCAAAQTLKHLTDSLQNANAEVNIIIAGDFNDYPNDVSITSCLGADKQGDLINLSLFSDAPGSYKYQGMWGFLDQIIVSKGLFERKEEGLLLGSDLQVFKPSFLLEEDLKYTGYKPFRTFIGYKYHKGYSDHLPVMIILK